MPYALVTGDDRLFAGLADGQIWQSSDRGDSWQALQALRQSAASAARAGVHKHLTSPSCL
jgi:hypothetical protein